MKIPFGHTCEPLASSSGSVCLPASMRSGACLAGANVIDTVQTLSIASCCMFHNLRRARREPRQISICRSLWQLRAVSPFFLVRLRWRLTLRAPGQRPARHALRSSQIGEEVSATCLTDIMPSDVKFTFTIIDADNIARKLGGMTEMEIQYVRCSL